MQQSSEYAAADIVGFYTRGPFAFLIRLGQRLAGVKFRGVTHVAVIATDGPDPDIIQSVRRVNRVKLSSYGATPRVVIPFPGWNGARVDVVEFAESYLGRKYGILSVVSRAWNCLTPRWVQFGINRSGDLDCSALAARAFEHGGVILPWADPWQVMPGQLADEYIKESV